jgi:hypothetical protein
MATKEGSVTFEDAEKTFTRELVLSDPNFTQKDIRTLAEIGALTVEDAQTMIVDIAKKPLPAHRHHCRDIMRKKVLVLLAKEKQDPDFQALMQLYAQIHAIEAKFEERYGAEATINQGSIIGKLVGKLREKTNFECVEKISNFQ